MAMRVLKSFILLVAFCSSSMLADDQNSSLINADKTVYVNLLKTIKESKVSNDEITLQKVLLEKLITTLPATVTNTALSLPTGVDEYNTLFNRYIDDALKKDALTTKIKSINTKIQSLTKEIKSLDHNNSSERTLQLQSALYTKSLQDFKAQNEVITNEIPSIEKMLIDSLKNITFDSENLTSETLAAQEDASKLRTTIDTFLVKKERFELLGDTHDKGISTAAISTKEEAYNKAVRTVMSSLFIEFSDALKSKNKKAFELEKSMLDEASSLENGAIIQEAIASLLHDMEKDYFGTIDTIKGSTVQEFKNILTMSWNIMSDPIFTVNGSPISMLKMILALLVFLIGIFGGGFYKTSIKRITHNSKSINLATRTILSNIGYYVIVITAFFVALNVMGIDLSSIALVAGALSVGIGFGLQNIVSNFVSGIILMFERSIKIGDFVELSDTLRGHVSDIRMRSTTLNTNGNIDVIVPNRNFIEGNVINWTMHDKLKRFDIPFGVAYGTKPEHVIAVVVQAVANSGYKDILITEEKYTNVIMTGMASSSVNFSLQVWIHGEEILAPSKTISRFLIIIYNTLYANGIEIPFPQHDLHIKSVDESVSLSLFPPEEKSDKEEMIKA